MNIEQLVNQLTFTTRGTLEMCGWYPDRVVDVSAYIQALNAKRLRAHPTEIDFLASFGGLVLRVPLTYFPSEVEEVCFDPIAGANADAHLQWWDGFQRVAGVQLTVIGRFSRQGELLSLDSNGAMYANEETDFCRFGNSLATSLNALCEARPAPERILYDKQLAFGA